MQNFSIIWRIQIMHRYYRSGKCRDFDLIPTLATDRLMKARGILYRKLGEATWGIVGLEEALLDQGDRIEFDLYCKDKNFAYVTESTRTLVKSCPKVEMDGNEESPFTFPITGYLDVVAPPGVIARVSLKLGTGKTKEIRKGRSNELVFKAPERYLEYIFLFRNGFKDKKLLIEDGERKIEFLSGEKINYMNNTGYRFKSMEKWLLMETPDTRLKLLEVYDVGRRILINKLPYPVPGRYIDAPSDVLRNVVYI